MIYKCDICEKEFEKAGSLALHKYRKHGIGKKEKKEKTPTEPEPKKINTNDWAFLGKKNLIINDTEITIKQQNEVKQKYGVMEINVESGDLR